MTEKHPEFCWITLVVAILFLETYGGRDSGPNPEVGGDNDVGLGLDAHSNPVYGCPISNHCDLLRTSSFVKRLVYILFSVDGRIGLTYSDNGPLILRFHNFRIYTIVESSSSFRGLNWLVVHSLFLLK